MGTELTIGQLATAAGVNVETIRYYQRLGLLDEPVKPTGGHRRYPAEQAKRLRFIKRAQALGFTLNEVAALLTLEQANACTETRDLALRKRELIEAKIRDLEQMHLALGQLVQQCDVGRHGAACPIIDVLAGQ
jgi:MerR family mercuric resistance operon transcriptional regulator